jgi:Ca-activated chloride channel family protein
MEEQKWIRVTKNIKLIEDENPQDVKSLKQMMNKRYFFLFALQAFLLVCGDASAQSLQEVQTDIVSQNDYNLSVIRVYPDSFPQVSVIFQAQNNLGMPIWKLSSEELNVMENGLKCEIIRVRNISKERPVNIGLVLDASGSMGAFNQNEVRDLYGEAYQDSMMAFFNSVDYASTNYSDKPWKDALDHAKSGIRGFLEEEALERDSVQLVIFANSVLATVDLTNNSKRVIEVVDSTYPGGGTAFYDALMTSIRMLPERSEKSVLVALTDGQDNGSISNEQDVILLANERGIKVYVVALGFAAVEPLQRIAESTGGFFYYTNDAAQLADIYRNIKRQIRSVYQLDYLSEHADAEVVGMDIRFAFTNDTLRFLNGDFEYELPAEAVEYIREQDRLRKIRNVALPFAAIALIGLTVFYLKRKRQKKKLVITQVYPNPFTDSFNINYEADAEDSTIIDVTLIDSKNQPVPIRWSMNSDKQLVIAVDKSQSGLHVVTVSTSSSSSLPMKLIRD